MLIDSNVVISLVAVAISLAALLWQSKAIRTSQTMQFTIETLMRDIRTDDFQRRQRTVLTELRPEIHNPACGISNLPEELGLAAWHVLFAYEIIGMMVARGMVDKEVLLSIGKYRICATWEALYRYIEVERTAIRKAPFVPFYENIYLVCRRTSLTDIYRRMRLARVDGKSWDSVLEKDDWALDLDG